MNKRQTSIDCYHQIKAEGLLSKRRMEVYEILFQDGPLTANEIVRISKIKYPNTNASSFNARLSELKRFGVIQEIGEKEDSISGKNCYIWDLTDRLPEDTEPLVNTKKDKKENVLNALRELYKKKRRAPKEDWINVANLVKGM